MAVLSYFELVGHMLHFLSYSHTQCLIITAADADTKDMIMTTITVSQAMSSVTRIIYSITSTDLTLWR